MSMGTRVVVSVLAATLASAGASGRATENPPRVEDIRTPALGPSWIHDYGYVEGRGFVDFTGDKRPDYCRLIGVAGNYSLKVTFAGGGNVIRQIADPGCPQGRAWGDFTGDGRADYLRVIGNCAGGHQWAVLITPADETGRNFGPEIMVAADIGYAEGRYWTDVDKDGKIDFVRFVGDQANPQAKVSFSGGGSTWKNEDIFKITE